MHFDRQHLSEMITEAEALDNVCLATIGSGVCMTCSHKRAAQAACKKGAYLARQRMHLVSGDVRRMARSAHVAVSSPPSQNSATGKVVALSQQAVHSALHSGF